MANGCKPVLFVSCSAALLAAFSFEVARASMANLAFFWHPQVFSSMSVWVRYNSVTLFFARSAAIALMLYLVSILSTFAYIVSRSPRLFPREPKHALFAVVLVLVEGAASADRLAELRGDKRFGSTPLPLLPLLPLPLLPLLLLLPLLWYLIRSFSLPYLIY